MLSDIDSVVTADILSAGVCSDKVLILPFAESSAESADAHGQKRSREGLSAAAAGGGVPATAALSRQHAQRRAAACS